jgi:hypothetical protein
MSLFDATYITTMPPTFVPPFLQTTISVEFKPLPSIAKYELEWKEVEKGWDKPAGSTSTSDVGGNKIKVEAIDLTPGMTYCIRAVCVGADGGKGAPGPELIIDTEQVGCTPKAEKSCCIVQ